MEDWGDKTMTKAFKTMKAFKDYFIIKAKKEGSEISVEETHQLIQKKEPIVLLDVREKEEIELGYIEGATFIPQGLLEQKVETFCLTRMFQWWSTVRVGYVPSLLQKKCEEKGYTHVFSMAKGINGWKEAGYEIVIRFRIDPGSTHPV